MARKKKRKVTDARAPQRIRYPVAVLVRMFVLGSVAVLAAVWAIWRQYTVPRMPMVVPVAPAPAASEIEIDTAE
ncbi:MAG: hypothetical protein KF850_17590 [Labilithrix sp.]|nr:hypothetical protein [Labilithrix sp.]